MGKHHSDSAEEISSRLTAQEAYVYQFPKTKCIQPAVDKGDSKAKGNLTLHPLLKMDELYAKLGGAKIFSALDLTSGYYHIELGSTS